MLLLNQIHGPTLGHNTRDYQSKKRGKCLTRKLWYFPHDCLNDNDSDMENGALLNTLKDGDQFAVLFSSGSLFSTKDGCLDVCFKLVGLEDLAGFIRLWLYIASCRF